MGKNGRNKKIPCRVKRKDVIPKLNKAGFKGDVGQFLDSVCENIVPIDGNIRIPDSIMKAHGISPPFHAQICNGTLAGII